MDFYASWPQSSTCFAPCSLCSPLQPKALLLLPVCLPLTFYYFYFRLWQRFLVPVYTILPCHHLTALELKVNLPMGLLGFQTPLCLKALRILGALDAHFVLGLNMQGLCILYFLLSYNEHVISVIKYTFIILYNFPPTQSECTSSLSFPSTSTYPCLIQRLSSIRYCCKLGLYPSTTPNNWGTIWSRSELIASCEDCFISKTCTHITVSTN